MEYHHNELRKQTRKESGKKAEQTLGIADSQSVKTTESGGIRGYDGGKKTKGRKRHVLVDTMGMILEAFVHRANMGDREGLKVLARRARNNHREFKKVMADGGYEGKAFKEWMQSTHGWILEIVKRTGIGFQILPKRWIVERTFAGLGKYRRLSKDYERIPKTSESFMKVAIIRLMLRRLSDTSYSTIGYEVKPCSLAVL
jgi:putative transposase